MARFVIIEDFVYQWITRQARPPAIALPAFHVRFRRGNIDVLVSAMIANMGETIDDLWQHCVAYPGKGGKDHSSSPISSDVS